MEKRYGRVRKRLPLPFCCTFLTIGLAPHIRFLLKTIESMESSGGRGLRSKRTKKPSPEAVQVLQAAVTQLHGSKGKSDADGMSSSAMLSVVVDSDVESPRGGEKDSTPPNAKGDAQAAIDLTQICTAVLAPGRSCKTKRIPGSVYCWRHAALDPNSTFTFCRFTDPDTHKKCSNTIQKSKKPLLCAHHIHRASVFIGDEAVMNGATEADISALLATIATNKASTTDNVHLLDE